MLESGSPVAAPWERHSHTELHSTAPHSTASMSTIVNHVPITNAEARIVIDSAAFDHPYDDLLPGHR